MSTGNRKRSSRLGRGLSSLMAQPAKVSQAPAEEPTVAPARAAGDPAAAAPAAEAAGGLRHLPIDALRANPHQPRQHFEPAALERLAASIRADGLMQPIVVRPAPAASDGQAAGGPAYELVAGERRWRAARLAGLETVPAIVRELDERQIAEWALIENLQREDLNPLERAEAFQGLVERFGLSHDEVAERVGLERSTISNLLRLLSLEESVQALVREGRLSMGQARALAGVSDKAQQARLAELAVKQGLSVRQVEALARQAAAAAGQAPAAEPSGKRVRSAYLADLEQQIAEQLQTRVQVRPGRKKGSGTLTIEFFSLDQFDSLLSKLGVETE